MEREIETKIRLFVSRFSRDHDLRSDDDIFALGLVNSLIAMQLVHFLEQEFGITIDDEDLDLENFRTINAMSALVTRKGGH